MYTSLSLIAYVQLIKMHHGKSRREMRMMFNIQFY